MTTLKTLMKCPYNCSKNVSVQTTLWSQVRYTEEYVSTYIRLQKSILNFCMSVSSKQECYTGADQQQKFGHHLRGIKWKLRSCHGEMALANHVKSSYPSGILSLSTLRSGSHLKSFAHRFASRFHTSSVAKTRDNERKNKVEAGSKVEEVKTGEGVDANDWENFLENDDKKKNVSSIPIKRENIFTVPNLLSFSRIVATPYIAHLVFSQQYSLALGMFMVAGMTDVLDGQIARRWPSQKSAFGTALDPLGDKILVTTLTITLTMLGIIPHLLTILIVGRDVLLMASVFYLRYRTCPPPLTLKRYFDPTLVNAKLNPTTISKVNTVLQMVVIWLSMCAPVFNMINHPFLYSLYIVTGITTVWSGASYILNKDTVQILKDN